MVKNSEAFCENAENCLHLADNAVNDPASMRYRRMAQAWTALAEEQDWLDGHPAQTQNERSNSLAEGAIDRLSDEGASGEDISNRKRHLIDGPAEFHGTRVDND
jgi:hypothetical protein